MLDFNKSVDLMLSSDSKDNLLGEILQLSLRAHNLRLLIETPSNQSLNLFEIYLNQFAVMQKYLKILLQRAALEELILPLDLCDFCDSVLLFNPENIINLD